jgi:hypothetical protein
MFRDGSGQRIFDRNDGSANGAILNAVKNFSRTGAGNNRTVWQHGFRRFVAERAELALNGYCNGSFHGWKVSGTGAIMQETR